MTTDELVQLNARVAEKNRPFEAILSNPDFIEWQKAGPVAELEAIKNQIVLIDRTNPLWKEQIAELVISYQAITRVIMGTVIKAQESRNAKQAIKELEKK